MREQYGDGVSVQITGGDPTLRKRDELVAIVREAARLGLEPSLMTNGIKLTRDLARELVEAGLTDVAIHVDLTQERKGYATEESLNAIRQEYIERVRGLGLHVIFNTTVFDGNFAEIPALLRFFSRNADVVGLVSFQIQAATGRGVLTEKNERHHAPERAPAHRGGLRHGGSAGTTSAWATRTATRCPMSSSRRTASST